jgi:hypothetical protein
MDWTAIAAGATAIMAIATFFLAFKTRSMAKETKAAAEATLKEAHAVEKQVEQVERQVSISAEALRVSAQPWLVWEPSFEVEADGMGAPVSYTHGGLYSLGRHSSLQVSEKDSSVVGRFTVRNVGNGIAILDMSKSFIFRQNNAVSYDDVHPSVETPVVPPGETVDVKFTIPASRSADHQRMTTEQLAGVGQQSFTVEVAYGDSLGNAETSAMFRAHRPNENSPWAIAEVEYRLDNGKVITTRRSGY